jgi:hypothetical protein
MNAAEVFSYRQYSNGILERLHADLRKVRYRDKTQSEQFARCREEMERRGMKLANAPKPNQERN